MVRTIAPFLVVIALTMPFSTGCDGRVPGDGDGGQMDAATQDAASADARVALDAEHLLDARPMPEDDAAPADSATVTPDAGVDAGCGCDDGIACTRDECLPSGECDHTIDHLACPSGEYCSATGCVGGPVCASDADCVRPDPCVLVSCDAARRVCVYSVLDGDADGHPPEVCGGRDCDDGRADVNPGVAMDLCDGVDADCSGGPDPLDAPGCSGAETCDGSACVCMSPAIECGTFSTRCVDPLTDRSNCGSCGLSCSRRDEMCVMGSCVCPAGTTVCPAACADTTSDPNHCGGCGVRCGEAVCSSGVCDCGPTASLCTTATGAIECADHASDARHCGACDHRCFASSECAGATCELEVGATLRGYAYTSPDTSVSRGWRVAAIDRSTGEMYARQWEEAYPIYEVGSSATLYTGGNMIVAYAADGAYRWSVPTTLDLGGVAFGGGRLYVTGHANAASATIGSTTFMRGATSGGFMALAELSTTTGDVLASTVLSYPGVVTSSPSVDVDDTGEGVFMFWWPRDIDLGGGTLPTTAGNAVIARFGPGLVHRASWRVPASGTAAYDVLGNIVAWGGMPYDPVSFGGAVIGTRGRAESYVVRYTSTGSHLNSWTIASGGRVVLTQAEGVLVNVTYVRPPLRYYPYVGDGAGTPTTPPASWLTVSASSYGITVDAAEQDATAIYLALDLPSGSTVDGRSVSGATLVRLNRATLAVESVGVIESRGTTLTSRDPGRVFEMGLVNPSTLRVAGELAGPLRFGARELSAVARAYGTYIADVSFLH